MTTAADIDLRTSHEAGGGSLITWLIGEKEKKTWRRLQPACQCMSRLLDGTTSSRTSLMGVKIEEEDGDAWGSGEFELPGDDEDGHPGQEDEDSSSDGSDSAGDDDEKYSGKGDEGNSSQTSEGIDDVEVAEILREAARINDLENYDVWFEMIGRPDSRLARARG